MDNEVQYGFTDSYFSHRVAAYKSVECAVMDNAHKNVQLAAYTHTFCNASCQTVALPRFTIQNFVHDAAAVHFYSGLENYEQFQFVLHTLGPAVYHLNYQYDGYGINVLSVEDQFFLTLIRFDLQDLMNFPVFPGLFLPRMDHCSHVQTRANS